MEYFSTDKIGRVFLLRLDPGDYVLESINELMHKEKIKDAVIISAIGTLDQCVLHMVTTTGYPSKEFFRRWEDKPLELTSIMGIIADGKPHLHAVVSDQECAYAGHLEEGCRTLYLAEIAIIELKDANLTRILDENKILRLKKKKI
ncbi:DNA-binding protein [Candidatus Bathyarchaeota archaeon]|nr:DNA-binding protein [Candidatus Bathyarchaeota archaeon]